MQLAEHAGKRRLAALVRTETTKMRSGPARKKSLGTTVALSWHELVRKRQVEGLAAADLLSRLRQLRLAEAQAGAPEFFNIREVAT